MNFDPKDADKAFGAALAAGKSLAPEAQLHLSVSATRTANTRFARSEITSSGDTDDRELSVSALIGKRHASVRMNQLDPASVRGAVERAIRLARLSPEDPEAMPVLGPQKYAPAVNAFDAATAALEAPAREAVAKDAIGRADEAKLDVSGFMEHGNELWSFATSAGARGHHASTFAQYSSTARTQDGTGSGWAGGAAFKGAAFDASALSKSAADIALRSQKPKRLEPGKYTVVLGHAAVSDLLDMMMWNLDARAADEGRSYFSKAGGGTKVGDALFPELITLRSDPASALDPSAPFDFEGLPLKPTAWIDKGKVTALRYSRYWAQKTGKQPTGNHEYTELVGGTAASLEELIKGVKRGVWINRFWYIRMVDPQSLVSTGLTRDGAFLIENGEVIGPVNNFRFNESPAVMLKNCDALTRDTHRIPDSALRVPALRTHEFNLASISEAV